MPSLREFLEKESKFEQQVNDKINDGLKGFSDKHPLISTAFKTSLHLLPPPFDTIAQNIYNTSDDSDEEKLKQVREFLNKIRTKDEDHFNRIVAKLDKICDNLVQLKDSVATQDTLLEIKDIIISKDNNIMKKLDEIIKTQRQSLSNIICENHLTDFKNNIIEPIISHLNNHPKAIALLTQIGSEDLFYDYLKHFDLESEWKAITAEQKEVCSLVKVIESEFTDFCNQNNIPVVEEIKKILYYDGSYYLYPDTIDKVPFKDFVERLIKTVKSPSLESNLNNILKMERYPS
jgi:hypothetical protein